MRSPYDQKHWKLLKADIIRRHPLCLMCLNSTPKKITPAKHVDHISGFSSRSEFFDRSNLQPLCVRCHSKKTHTAGGPDYLRKAKERLENKPTRFKI